MKPCNDAHTQHKCTRRMVQLPQQRLRRELKYGRCTVRGAVRFATRAALRVVGHCIERACALTSQPQVSHYPFVARPRPALSYRSMRPSFSAPHANNDSSLTHSPHRNSFLYTLHAHTLLCTCRSRQWLSFLRLHSLSTGTDCLLPRDVPLPQPQCSNKLL